MYIVIVKYFSKHDLVTEINQFQYTKIPINFILNWFLITT